jgi:hypothetical protein
MDMKLMHLFLNAVALVGILPSGESASTAQLEGINANPQKNPITPAVVNAASTKAIEGSWLRIPHLCKARHAAFDPVRTGEERASAEALALQPVIA